MDPIRSQEAAELFEAQSHLYKHILNYLSSMSLKCAIQLGIPDTIHNHGQPITLTQLVSSLQIHPTKASCLQRVMSLLVHSGIFAKTEVQENKEEVYSLTPTSRLLLKDKSPCLTPYALLILHPDHINTFHGMEKWLRGKELTLFDSFHGMSFWDFMNPNPEFSNLFNEAMASDSQLINLVIRDCKQIFEGVGSLVDVGGGSGTLARIISEAFPHLKCTVFDLPHVVANLPESENLNYVGGDMFQTIPPADMVLMKCTLHDWGDEECVTILKKCRDAIPSKGEGGKVVIIDIVMNHKKDDGELTQTKLYFDLLLVTTVAGRERTDKEWEKLFLEAGFKNYKITPMFGLRSLIELYP